jgi:hypothetical protein
MASESEAHGASALFHRLRFDLLIMIIHKICVIRRLKVHFCGHSSPTPLKSDAIDS